MFLVGAGPGDIGLLTVKGLQCLRRAEVVVYDFHLNAQVLNYINHEAEFIYAGKRGGRHTMTQDEINALLLEKAMAGKTICRLKGGDPFVFGRGGEEAEVLARGGIEFEVVPGVSSAVAAPAYAGIPLTHRLYSSSFAVVPGYEDVMKQESTIDWSKLATGVGTLVFLMAVKNIDIIAQRLRAYGRPADTPVAVIRWGTRPDQKTLVSTLKDIARDVKEKDIKPPAVMVVGEVVRLRESLKWYEQKLLFGHRILVTRKDLEDFSSLDDLGAEIVEFPTVEIVPPEDYGEIDRAIDHIEGYHWLIFTSRNGVKYFFKRFFAKNRDIRDLQGIRICAIGTRTSHEVKNFGLKVDLVPEAFRAEGLVHAFVSFYDRQPVHHGRESGADTPASEVQHIPGDDTLRGVKFLLPRAAVARDVFPDAVRSLGGEIDVPIAYRAVRPESHGKRMKRFLREGRISIATFTSAATFDNFLQIMGDDAMDLLKGVTIAVIGPVTAKAVEKAGLHVEIMPSEATIRAMVREIIAWAQARTGKVP